MAQDHRFLFVDCYNRYFNNGKCNGKFSALVSDTDAQLKVLDLSDMILQKVSLGDALSIDQNYFINPIYLDGNSAYYSIGYNSIGNYLSDNRLYGIELNVSGVRIDIDIVDSAVRINGCLCGIYNLDEREFFALDHGEHIRIFTAKYTLPTVIFAFAYRSGGSLILAYSLHLGEGLFAPVCLMYDLMTQAFQGYHFFNTEGYFNTNPNYKQPKLAKEVLR